MKATLLLLVVMLSWAHAGEGGVHYYYASPNGSAGGDGTILRPWDLATALQDNTKPNSRNSSVKPGDAIWLRAGTFGAGGATTYQSQLVGASNAPITIRQYPSEHAVVNGGIAVYGAWTSFWGFEIMNSDANRTNTTAGRPGGLNFYGPGNKAINIVVHDTGQPGIGNWSQAGDPGEIYGCILWGNGLYDVDNGWNGTPRGSGLYLQNRNGSFNVTDVISFKNFTTGMKAYAETVYADGFQFDGNIAFSNIEDSFELDSYTYPQQRIKLTANCAYGCADARMGVYGVHGQDLQMTGNYFVSNYSPAASINKSWSQLVLSSNTFVVTDRLDPWGTGTRIFRAVSTNMVSQPVDNNSYLGGGVGLFGVDPNQTTLPLYLNGLAISFSDWKSQTGWDSHSSYITSLPTQNVIILRTNKFESGRAHVVVFNWESKASINLNLAGIGLQSGQGFEVRDVQNFLGAPILQGNFAPGSPISVVPLNSISTTPLVGKVVHFQQDPNLHTPISFNVFVILPKTSDSLSSPKSLRKLE